MGERMKHGQAKGFRHRENEHYSELSAPSLLSHSRTEDYQVAYHCQAAPDVEPQKGSAVLARIVGEVVQVMGDGARLLGEIDGEEALRLIKVMAGEPMCGLAEAEIDSVSALGDFAIVLKQPDDDDGAAVPEGEPGVAENEDEDGHED